MRAVLWLNIFNGLNKQAAGKKMATYYYWQVTLERKFHTIKLFQGQSVPGPYFGKNNLRVFVSL